MPVPNRFELATARSFPLSNSRNPTGAVPPVSAYPSNAFPGFVSNMPVLNASTRLSPRADTQRVDPSEVSTARTGEHPAFTVATIADDDGFASAAATLITVRRPLALAV